MHRTIHTRTHPYTHIHTFDDAVKYHQQGPDLKHEHLGHGNVHLAEDVVTAHYIAVQHADVHAVAPSQTGEQEFLVPF